MSPLPYAERRIARPRGLRVRSVPATAATAPADPVNVDVRKRPSQPILALLHDLIGVGFGHSDGIKLAIAGVEVRVGAEAKPRTIEAVIRALKASS